MTITDAEPLSHPSTPAQAAAQASATIDLTERSEPTSARPTFTITDAAAACAVSRKTITRKLADLALHGAAKDDDGIWRIPVEALLAVGLHPGRSLPGTAARPATPAPTPTPVKPTSTPIDTATDVVTVSRQRWDDLRIRLARAEAEASERALALADARLALRALTAGPARAGEGPASSAVSASSAVAQEPAPLNAAGPGPIVLEGTPARAPEPAAAAPAASENASQGTPDAASQLAAARSHAAQNGGYVPAAPAAQPRKRRWWQSK